MIDFSCMCGKKFRAKDASVGVVMRCPACHEEMIVPDPSAVVLEIVVNEEPKKPASAPHSSVPDVVLMPRRQRKAGKSWDTPIRLFNIAFFVLLIVTFLMYMLQPNRHKSLIEEEADIRAYEAAQAEADRWRENAKLFGPEDPKVTLENKKHRWLGGGGKVVRFTAREDLPKTDSWLEKDDNWNPVKGLTVAIVDDRLVPDTSQDVLLGFEFTNILETRLPGLEHRREETSLASVGVIFAVPRGTLAKFIESKKSELLYDVYFVKVELGDKGETAWVPADSVRPLSTR